jgi:hypothetical protein
VIQAPANPAAPGTNTPPPASNPPKSRGIYDQVNDITKSIPQ